MNGAFFALIILALVTAMFDEKIGEIESRLTAIEAQLKALP